MTKEEDDNIARRLYLEAKSCMPSDITDLVLQRKIPAEKVTSDMALFRKKIIENNTTLTYYFNRIEIRCGNHLDVLPFNVAYGK